jgi:hypothetical protein
MVGAMLWSLVVGFITAISNLEMLSREIAWLREIRGSLLYKLINDYLAVAMLLMLLTILPFLFDGVEYCIHESSYIFIIIIYFGRSCKEL